MASNFKCSTGCNAASPCHPLCPDVGPDHDELVEARELAEEREAFSDRKARTTWTLKPENFQAPNGGSVVLAVAYGPPPKTVTEVCSIDVVIEADAEASRLRAELEQWRPVMECKGCGVGLNAARAKNAGESGLCGACRDAAALRAEVEALELHNPLTCPLCHAEGFGTELASLRAENERLKLETDRWRQWSGVNELRRPTDETEVPRGS